LNQYALALDSGFVADLMSSTVVSLHIVPQSSELGFTFHSRNFGDPSLRPQLLVTAASVISGDLNCDGVVDTQDVAPFALSLVDPGAYAASYPRCDIERADVNHDGSIDGVDVAGFVALLE